MSLVYISSTYQDLVEQRKAAQEAIRRAEHEAVGMEDYSATEKRPLDKCLEDVRRCKAYVGLIGWRYGFTPRGQTQSITRLEYEEAGHHGIPRLIFLTPDDDWPLAKRDADPAKIRNFREHVRANHIINVFENIHDLKFKVVAGIKRDLGEGIAIPPLLPYRCNRNEQYEDFSAGFANAGLAQRSSPSATPILCFACGEEPQAINKFVQCIREDLVALLQIPGNEAIGWKEVSWPRENSVEAVQTAFTRRLARALDPGLGVATPDHLPSMIDGHSGPLVVHSRLYTDEWGTERALAPRAIADYWCNLTLRARNYPAVLLVTVEYREGGNLFERLTISRRNRAIRAVLRDLAGRYKEIANVVFVRELDDVRRHDVEEWGDTEVVQSVLKGADIRDDVRHIYRGSNQMPMRPLADELRSVLLRTVEMRRS